MGKCGLLQAMFPFDILARDPGSKARTGTFQTGHGPIETPIFMPVGTVGSVKAVMQEELTGEIGAQIILGNTYHLYLRPGLEVLRKAGGLHPFMGWGRPILTDSGGYQVFSLGANRKISEEGVLFQSHIDGSSHLFTPENVVDTQRSIGADIIMAFDECLAYPSELPETRKSMELTHRWLDRCLNRLKQTSTEYGYSQAFFPIVQGGTFRELREISAAYIAEKDCPGNAIGGLSVGEPQDVLYELCAGVCDRLPDLRPRYLMGVGTPWNLLECIALGVDMFDCVIPTRNGRNGMLFTSNGVINIRNKKWEMDFSPIDEGIPCFASNHYSKAYLRHLFVSNEILGLQIASIHNLALYLDLMKQVRAHIRQGDFNGWRKTKGEQLQERL